jgi:hypothetical protein
VSDTFNIQKRNTKTRGLSSLPPSHAEALSTWRFCPSRPSLHACECFWFVSSVKSSPVPLFTCLWARSRFFLFTYFSLGHLFIVGHACCLSNSWPDALGHQGFCSSNAVAGMPICDPPLPDDCKPPTLAMHAVSAIAASTPWVTECSARRKLALECRRVILLCPKKVSRPSPVFIAVC